MPAGCYARETAADTGGQLTKQRIAAARASLNPNVATYSKLRYISLKHLEKAIADHQGVPTDEMRNLAGLLRLRYVFLYPDSKDIVIAGPAEGWVADRRRPPRWPEQRTARHFVARPGGGPAGVSAGGNPDEFIGCSIDPTQEGLAAMQQFLRSTGPTATPADTANHCQRFAVQPWSADDQRPRRLAEHAFRLCDGRGRLSDEAHRHWAGKAAGSHGELCRSRQPGGGQPQRDAAVVLHARLSMRADRRRRQAMELVGDGVKLVGENELVSAEGQRQGAGRSDAASQAFVNAFTKQYSELAERSPVYAELRNLIDLAVAAAYMQHAEFLRQGRVEDGLIGQRTGFAVETYDMPKQVATAVNAIWKGIS